MRERVGADAHTTAPRGGQRTIALELAPINRILYGSDAFAGPEQIWLGAKVAKAALARVFTDLLHKDFVTEEDARDAARAILAGNARVLYGVLG